MKEPDRTTLTPQEERLALLEKDLMDMCRAMDDLSQIVAEEKSKREVYRRVLISLAQKINGWVENNPSDDVLRALPIQLDVLLATSHRDVERMKERMESMKQMVDQSIARRHRARRARVTRCIKRVKK